MSGRGRGIIGSMCYAEMLLFILPAMVILLVERHVSGVMCSNLV